MTNVCSDLGEFLRSTVARFKQNKTVVLVKFVFEIKQIVFSINIFQISCGTYVY